jgi:hypothetical protein
MENEVRGCIPVVLVDTDTYDYSWSQLHACISARQDKHAQSTYLQELHVMPSICKPLVAFVEFIPQVQREVLRVFMVSHPCRACTAHARYLEKKSE